MPIFDDTIRILNNGYVGTIAGIVGAGASIIAIYVAIKSKKNKKLSISIPKVVDIFNLKDGLTSEIKVFYKDEEVNNISLVDFEVINDGNVHIDKEDFQESVIIDITGRIFSIECIVYSPHNLKPIVEQDGNKIILHGMLLNPTDNFLIRLYVNNYQKYTISSRIKGIKYITRTRDRSNNKEIESFLTIFFIVLVGIVVFGLYLETFYPKSPSNTDSAISAIVFLFVIFFCIKSYSWLNKLKKYIYKE